MKLDRETQALLHWVASGKPAALSELAVDAARAEYRRTLARTELPPPPVRQVDNLSIPAAGRDIDVRVYHPTHPGKTAPAIMFLHGGGCVVGDLDTHDVLCRTLCQDASALVMAVDYRLAPEHPFPAAVEDGVSALIWLSHNAGTLGADPDRIAIAGDSAGGGIAAVAAHETKGHLSAPLRAQVLLYPALDLKARLPSRRQFAEVFPVPEPLIDWFHGHYFGQRSWPRTDPRAHPVLYPDYSDLPPTLIVTAGHDPLRDEAIEYAEMLATAGVDVEHICAQGTIHGFLNIGRVLRTAYRETRPRIASYLKQRLR